LGRAKGTRGSKNKGTQENGEMLKEKEAERIRGKHKQILYNRFHPGTF
jgi:hypothetical protein